jgi:hypothetical protein
VEFSHSEIPGSKLASSSPRLIAGNHVLHRLVVPRHPSYALKYLTILCSLRQAQGKPLTVEDLLYDHLTLLLFLILDILTCISDALFINLQNCVGTLFGVSIRQAGGRVGAKAPYRDPACHSTTDIVPLPIFVVKLQTIISIIIWFRFCLNR